MSPNKKTLEDLELLFKFIPPDKLKTTITFFLMQHLMSGETADKELYQDIYFLLEFLEKQKT